MSNAHTRLGGQEVWPPVIVPAALAASSERRIQIGRISELAGETVQRRNPAN
jgi:hypothetical protein